MDTPILTKEVARTLFELWIKQRPGLDPTDYGFSPDQWQYNPKANHEAIRIYRNEANSISRDRQRALTAFRQAFSDWTPWDADALLKACQWAFSGRLQIKHDSDKGWYIDYCTGQYWPTEYRVAAACVLEKYLDFIYPK